MKNYIDPNIGLVTMAFTVVTPAGSTYDTLVAALTAHAERAAVEDDSRATALRMLGVLARARS